MPSESLYTQLPIISAAAAFAWPPDAVALRYRRSPHKPRRAPAAIGAGIDYEHFRRGDAITLRLLSPTASVTAKRSAPP